MTDKWLTVKSGVELIDPPLRAAKLEPALLEREQQVGRAVRADDLVLIPAEHEDFREAVELREVGALLFGAGREDGENPPRLQRLRRDRRPVDHEPAAARIADADERPRLAPEDVERRLDGLVDVLRRAVAARLLLVTRVDDRAPARDEVPEPRPVMHGRDLARVAVAVDEDDDPAPPAVPWRQEVEAVGVVAVLALEDARRLRRGDRPRAGGRRGSRGRSVVARARAAAARQQAPRP